MDLKEKVRNLPLSPGVYLMKDSSGSIIYVGKSKKLKNRVGSYFQNSKNHPPKVEKLVKNLKDFEYILTDTEFEAFMLECKLIKDLKPLYNRKMKNPLSYVYIIIKMTEKYPSIEMTSSRDDNDNNLYFGPYTSKSTVEKAIQGIKENCKIMCSNPSINRGTCLNYSLGLCIGICMGGSAAEQYHSIINNIIALLNGTNKNLIREMKKKMLLASEKFDFEAAAKYRDYINALTSLLDKEKVIDFTEGNKNIVMIEHLGDSTIKLFLIKGNKVLFSKKHNLKNINSEQLSTIIQKNILDYFKTADLNSPVEVGKNELDESQIIYSYLKSSSCRYTIIHQKWVDSKNKNLISQEVSSLLCYNK